MENLKPSTPTFRFGKRIIAIEHREWKGKKQLGFVEVAPDLDPRSLQLRGWTPIFRGVRLSCGDAEFLQNLREIGLVLLRPSDDSGSVPLPGITPGS